MTDISTLAAETSRLLNFYQGAESTINTKLNQVLHTEHRPRIPCYVDAENGDDSNDGLTELTPIRTVNQFFNIINENITFGTHYIARACWLKAGQTHVLNQNHSIRCTTIFLPYGNVAQLGRPVLVFDGGSITADVLPADLYFLRLHITNVPRNVNTSYIRSAFSVHSSMRFAHCIFERVPEDSNAAQFIIPASSYCSLQQCVLRTSGTIDDLINRRLSIFRVGPQTGTMNIDVLGLTRSDVYSDPAYTGADLLFSRSVINNHYNTSTITGTITNYL